MIKLFVSDIDGTLMDRSKQIRQEDIDAIRLANEQGVHICLASGRMYEEIKVVMDVLGVPCYAICQNGATIVDQNGTVIQASRFDRELALNVHRYVAPAPLVTVICGSEGNYVAENSADTERVGQRFLTPLIENSDILDQMANGMPVTKFSIYGEIPRLEQMLVELDQRFAERITASFSDPDGIDVMPGGVDKGAAVECLMQLLGVRRGETACIGDSFNDLAMFRICSRSFAMSHSHGTVLSTATHQADTVSQALQDLLVG
ncbi:HAD family hydrolase [Paenibacillus glycanilyticus]|uniref:Haloacid dehalogenase n=1 Tax=Paenibacillus glycanilyticus TaxID=126569 RepID=A0ABQ6GNT6_9BACL|nr:HAD family hydrolase [Paenibacillus glycanilyticus]GLX71267.1 haloacid dehalogenase [Paenibacillus glycanilyticus]